MEVFTQESLLRFYKYLQTTDFYALADGFLETDYEQENFKISIVANTDDESTNYGGSFEPKDSSYEILKEVMMEDGVIDEEWNVLDDGSEIYSFDIYFHIPTAVGCVDNTVLYATRYVDELYERYEYI